MAYAPVPLYVGVLPSSTSTLYTVPGGGAVVIVKEILLINTGTADRQATIWFVPSGSSAGAGNAVAFNVTVSVGNPLVIPLSTALAAGDFIQANSANSISGRISGVLGP
jgi:hypothetical protein